MNQTTHPTEQQLLRYAQGELAEPEEQQLEHHLEQCDSCCQALDALPEDTLVGLVRGADTSVAEESADDSEAAGEIPPELADHPRYHVLEQIARGGMGAVYRAEHRMMHRIVALKTINPQLTRRPEVVDRFKREVRATAQLKHPNIVTVHDADSADDLHFLVMEYVEGTDLAALVAQRGPLPVDEACRYIRQAAEGLAHAHAHGMVHRDIKPHNLMLAADGSHSQAGAPQKGVIKILDFGLANLASQPSAPHDAPEQDAPDDSQLTRHGTLIGTLDYIAPEQADDPHSADIRSDIYSLGATLYFLLAGKAPFAEATGMNKLHGHKHWTPEAIESIRMDIPDELADVLRRMMSKNPAERLQTPEEVAQALAPFVDRHRVPPVRQPSYMPPPPPQRAPSSSVGTVLAVVGLAFLLLIVVGGVYLMLARRNTYQRALVERKMALQVEQAARTQAEAQRRALQSHLERNEFPLKRPGQSEWLVWSPSLLTGGQAPLVSLAAAQQWIAAGDDQGVVRLWNTRSDPGRHIRPAISLPGPQGPAHVALAKDAPWLAVGASNGAVGLWRLPLEAADPDDLPPANALIVNAHQGPVNFVAMSPNGRYLLTAGDSQVKLWELTLAQGSEPSWESSEIEMPALVQAAFDDSNTTFATLDINGQVDKWSVGEGPPLGAPQRKTRFLRLRRESVMALGPDGRVAIGCQDGRVVMFNKDSHLRCEITVQPPAQSLQFSSDGRTLLVANSRELLCLETREGHITARIEASGVFKLLTVSGDSLISMGHNENRLRLWRGLLRNMN